MQRASNKHCRDPEKICHNLHPFDGPQFRLLPTWRAFDAVSHVSSGKSQFSQQRLTLTTNDFHIRDPERICHKKPALTNVVQSFDIWARHQTLDTHQVRSECAKKLPSCCKSFLAHAGIDCLHQFELVAFVHVVTKVVTFVLASFVVSLRKQSPARFSSSKKNSIARLKIMIELWK